MIKRIFANIVSAILGLWLSVLFVPGVAVNLLPGSNFFGFRLDTDWKLFFILGIIMGLINFLIRPIINTIALPPRTITVGLLEVALNMATIWLLAFMSKGIIVPFWVPLLETALIVWIINLLILKIIKVKE